MPRRRGEEALISQGRERVEGGGDDLEGRRRRLQDAERAVDRPGESRLVYGGKELGKELRRERGDPCARVGDGIAQGQRTCLGLGEARRRVTAGSGCHRAGHVEDEDRLGLVEDAATDGPANRRPRRCEGKQKRNGRKARQLDDAEAARTEPEDSARTSVPGGADGSRAER